MSTLANILSTVQQNTLAKGAEKLSSMRDKNVTNLVSEELLLQWVTGIVIGLFAMALFFFFSTLISRALNNKKQVVIDELNNKYLMFLTELISGDATDAMYKELELSTETTLSLDKDDITDPRSRKVLKANLLELYRHISGDEKKKLRNVYLMLGYAKETVKSLKSRDYETRVNAIHELSLIDVKDAYADIFELINDKAETVRDAAIKARARRAEQPLAMLEQIQYPLSAWQQTAIYNAIVRYHKDNIPSFAPYIKLEDERIVRFSIKMASTFQQVECINELFVRLNDSSKDIRLEVIAALVKFESIETKNKLIERLVLVEDTIEELAILTSLKGMIEDTDTDWLLDKLSSENREVVITCSRMLRDMDKNKDLLSYVTDENEDWVKHAIDQSIQRL